MPLKITRTRHLNPRVKVLPAAAEAKTRVGMNDAASAAAIRRIVENSKNIMKGVDQNANNRGLFTRDEERTAKVR